MGAEEMPIRRSIEDGVIFTPKTHSATSKALEATREILGIRGTKPSVKRSRGSLSAWPRRTTT
jgi:hypothetical protein